MNKKQRDKILADWAEAIAVIEAEPRDVGAWAWVEATGKSIAYARVLNELADDRATFLKWLDEAKKQAVERFDSIPEKHRATTGRPPENLESSVTAEGVERVTVAGKEIANIGIGGPVEDGHPNGRAV